MLLLLLCALCGMCACTQVLESAGPVVELVLLRDRVARESKGSAFVWYASAADADRVSGPTFAAALRQHDFVSLLVIVTLLMTMRCVTRFFSPFECSYGLLIGVFTS
jgi:hypothetical protein